MRALLAHRDRDFELTPGGACDEAALTRDLGLDILVQAMAGGDEFIAGVARRALFASPGSDLDTVLYRQAALRDCLADPRLVRSLYVLVTDTLKKKHRDHWSRGILKRYPTSILHGSNALLRLFFGALKALRDLGAAGSGQARSEAFTRLFRELGAELDDAYLAEVTGRLDGLEFKEGLLLSERLDEGGRGSDYLVREAPAKRGWWSRLFERIPEDRTFRIAERDIQGRQNLSRIEEKGINRVANVLAQSADHVSSYFESLRVELGFYVGCLNLKERLDALGAPICFPTPGRPGERHLRAKGLYDPCMALELGKAAVGNDCDAKGRRLFIITGANRGGKSSFLRALGLAQLMTQAGLFVAGEAFESDLCPGLFTHFKREEDASMNSGRFDEELVRLSDLVDRLRPGALILFNESFSSTNEREGSEVAFQVVQALLDKGMRVLFVTHFHTFAERFTDEQTLFLRAQRLADGTRTFRVEPGAPLETSYGEDLYHKVFGQDTGRPSA